MNQMLGGFIAVGVVLLVLPAFNGGGFLALVIIPVYILAGVTATVVQLRMALRERSAGMVAASLAPGVIVLGFLFVATTFGGHVEDLLFRLLFETRRRRYASIVAQSKPGGAEVTVDQFQRTHVYYFVEMTPPFRVVFPVQESLFGWQAVVYDSSQSFASIQRVSDIINATRRRNSLRVPDGVPVIFGHGFVDECRPLGSSFYRCWFSIPE